MTKLLAKNTTNLRNALNVYYDGAELRDLCADLEVDYDSLPAEGKAGKVRELVNHLRRRERIQDLIVICSKQRPRVNWYELVEVASEPGQQSDTRLRKSSSPVKKVSQPTMPVIRELFYSTLAMMMSTLATMMSSERWRKKFPQIIGLVVVNVLLMCLVLLSDDSFRDIIIMFILLIDLGFGMAVMMDFD